ncbi:MAG: DedA family protein [Candidatus Yanofskybacteria bacterium]|nr:DedA family protein [Candidatus Yanofskybacteria bacterium]
MMLESAAIPIPSEVVLPFGGFLASSGQLNFWLVVLVATLANLAGSIILYWIGFFGGQPVLERYGKYVLIHRGDIARLDRWLGKYGAKLAFVSRLLPGVRTFSSVVLGVGRLNFNSFFGYTLSGSFIWNLSLAYIGLIMGENWNILRPYFHKFDLVIVILILIAAVVFVRKHLRRDGRKPGS